MRHVKKLVPTLLALIAAAALAACGGSDSSAESNESEAVSGSFALLAGAPSGYKDLSGEATLERADGGTTVSLDLSGLMPNTEYIAHLHTGGCGESDPGGPHFQFEAGGPEEPPNEIHLEFGSDSAGDGVAKASSKREVPAGEAGSVVLHADDHKNVMAAFVHEGEHHDDHGGDDHGGGRRSHSDKIACAELEGGSASAQSAEGGSGAVPTIEIEDGAPVGGVTELEFDAGDQIRFRVESDVADEVHVHGYDLSEQVAAGGTASFDFPAEIEGIFEVELEERVEQIAELRVNP